MDAISTCKCTHLYSNIFKYISVYHIRQEFIDVVVFGNVFVVVYKNTSRTNSTDVQTAHLVNPSVNHFVKHCAILVWDTPSLKLKSGRLWNSPHSITAPRRKKWIQNCNTNNAIGQSHQRHCLPWFFLFSRFRCPLKYRQGDTSRVIHLLIGATAGCSPLPDHEDLPKISY